METNFSYIYIYMFVALKGACKEVLCTCHFTLQSNTPMQYLKTNKFNRVQLPRY